MLAFQAQVPKEVLEAGSQAADTLTKSVLGSLVVLFIITTGIAIWLAWKAKQSELDSIKQIMSAQTEDKVEAKEFALAQNKVYEDVAKAVGENSKATEKLAKRIDSLARAIPGVDIQKFFAERD